MRAPRRAEDPERVRASERLSKQRRRQNDPAYRVVENFQRQVRRSLGGENGRFQRDYLDIKLGSSRRIRDSIWFDVNLSTMSSVRK